MRRFFIVLVFVVAAAVAVNQLGRAGYCFSEGRWVSEREKIEAAATLALGGGNSRNWTAQIRPGEAPVEFRTPPYASGAEFVAANPDCCRIGVDIHPEMRPITRGQPGITTVVVDFQVNAVAPDADDRPFTARTTVAVDRCGRRSDRFGFFRVGRTSWHD